MKAAFTTAVWYEISATCQTPLRTGGTDNDPETVLMDEDRRLLIQGSSIAGAMRKWLEKSGGDADGLFGCTAGPDTGRIHPGRLRISDGVFRGDAETALRPRLKLEPKSRTAEDKKKFDMASIQAGAKFDFHLIWLGGEARMKDDTDAIERMLSALHSGEIRLGAQKSNGFGRIALRYRRREYTLSNPTDREDWLDRKPPEGEWKTPAQLTGGQETVFTLRFHADSLLVKAGAVEIVKEDGGDRENRDRDGGNKDGGDGDDRTVTKPIMDGGRPVIPGSSVKGAVRSRVEKIAARKGLSGGVIDAMFGRMGQGKNDTGAAGVVQFCDIPLPAVKRPRISRIRVNRFTGGVIRAGLFTEEPVSTCRGGSAPAELRVSLPASQKMGCALLLYALRDLAWNLYGLGSGRSVGRGNLDAVELEIRRPDGGVTLFRFRDGFRIEPEGDLETVRDWMTDLEAARDRLAEPETERDRLAGLEAESE